VIADGRLNENLYQEREIRLTFDGPFEAQDFLMVEHRIKELEKFAQSYRSVKKEVPENLEQAIQAAQNTLNNIITIIEARLYAPYEQRLDSTTVQAYLNYPPVQDAMDHKLKNSLYTQFLNDDKAHYEKFAQLIVQHKQSLQAGGANAPTPAAAAATSTIQAQVTKTLDANMQAWAQKLFDYVTSQQKKPINQKQEGSIHSAEHKAAAVNMLLKEITNTDPTTSLATKLSTSINSGAKKFLGILGKGTPRTLEDALFKGSKGRLTAILKEIPDSAPSAVLDLFQKHKITPKNGGGAAAPRAPGSR
jgi:hypothetical protein